MAFRRCGRLMSLKAGRNTDIGNLGSHRRYSNAQALRATSLGIVVLYMIVEHFKNDDPIPVYRRFRDRGRLAPDGLQYISSWVDEKLEHCFQIMETADRNLLDQWIANWSDIVEFNVFPVISSKEAAAIIAPRL
jgi:Protein of unknown function (DUF3303)